MDADVVCIPFGGLYIKWSEIKKKNIPSVLFIQYNVDIMLHIWYLLLQDQTIF